MRVVPLLAYLALTGAAFAAQETKPTLLELAKKKFASRQLTAAEVDLFTKTEEGKPASALRDDDKENDPENAGNWTDQRVIHAECLAWLCTDSEASKRVTYRGVEIYGARIDGALNLEFAQIDFLLRMWKCAFTEGIVLRNSHCKGLYFQHSHVTNLAADGAKIDGDFFFNDSSKAEGALTLVRATIGGDFICSSAKLSNASGISLSANSAKIEGRVFLTDGFKSEGAVDFVGATIGGALICSDAELVNPEGLALNAGAARIDGEVFLTPHFKSIGDVKFNASIIGGNLECDGAQFTSSKDGSALSMNGAKINGSALMRNGLKAQGEVNFLLTTIERNLDFIGAELVNPGKEALVADGAKIHGNVYFRDNFKADGEISFQAAEVAGYFEWWNIRDPKKAKLNLRAAKVAILSDGKVSWPAKGGLFLDGFSYSRIDEGAPTDASTRIKWLHRQSRVTFLPQPYEQLASVLRTMGHEREARKVMIEKNRDHATFTRRFSHEWWWYNVFGWVIGYGYAPSRAFFISLAWILLGYALFKRGYSGCNQLILPTDDRAYLKDGGQIVVINNRPRFSEDYPSFNAFICSLESFTPLLKLDQSSNWAPNARRGKSFRIWRWELTTGSLLRAYLWIHIIAGWVFTSLWVGAVTGLVKS